MRCPACGDRFGEHVEPIQRLLEAAGMSDPAGVSEEQRVRAERDAAREDAARLAEALEVIHTATRDDEHEQFWDARKWLDEHGVFNDDLADLRVIAKVARAALSRHQEREPALSSETKP